MEQNRSFPNDNTLPNEIDMDQFRKMITDFLKDLLITFPEFSHLLIPVSNLSDNELLTYIQSIYPERIFDILYENNDIFLEESTVNTFFLPNVDFKQLFNAKNVSETTKTSIWKYLQLILFSVIGTIYDKNQFGDTSQLFEGINSEELNAKFTESFESLSSFFKKMDNDANCEDANCEDTNCEYNNNGNGNHNENNKQNTEHNIPNPNAMNEHLNKLFEGKIGRLATEMATELESKMGEMFPGTEPPKSSKDLIKLFMKNPSKIMEIGKLVLNKLNQKMKNGDISEEELKKETSEIFKGMKSSKDFKEVFETMSKTMGFGKNAKMNTSLVNKMIQKEKMKETLNKRKNAQQQQTDANGNVLEQLTPNHYVFKSTEKQEKSTAPPPKSQDNLSNQNDLLTPDELMKKYDLTNNIVSTNQPKNKKPKNKKNKQTNK